LLYYLQSRYYDPEFGRFISKDDPSYHDGQDAIGSNLYGYVYDNLTLIVIETQTVFIAKG
jgi:RHS repeat-associated protein